MVGERKPFHKGPRPGGPGGAAGGRPGPGGRPGGFRKRGAMMPKKVCRFCADKMDIDYKNINMLRTFITDKGKVLAGRVTGTCAGHQRILGAAIKRARMLALIPFTAA